MARPVRVLPGELPDGSPAPNAPQDVLVLDPAEVPASETATVGPGPLVCPLDLRPRSAAALAGFLTTTQPVLRQAMFTQTHEQLRGHVTDVMADAGRSAVHMISSTWTVPLPWFALVRPEDRVLVLAPRDDPARQVCWRAAMADVRRRAARAYSVAKDAIGDEGPTEVLRDTARWLENFHPHSAVELDYGGIVQLIDDKALREDTSAEDVHAILAAMEAGDAEEIATRYDRLRNFWAEPAARERFN